MKQSWANGEQNTCLRHVTYHMRVFDMTYVGTCEGDRMPSPSSLGLHGAYRILGI